MIVKRCKCSSLKLGNDEAKGQVGRFVHEMKGVARGTIITQHTTIATCALCSVASGLGFSPSRVPRLYCLLCQLASQTPRVVRFFKMQFIYACLIIPSRCLFRNLNLKSWIFGKKYLISSKEMWSSPGNWDRHDEMKGQFTLNIAPSANANVEKSIL